MSVAATVQNITATEIAYAPAVLAGVQAAETSNAAGSAKAQAVIDGIIAGSAAASGVASPTVAGISALVNLTVSILNALGVFSHKPKAATA